MDLPLLPPQRRQPCVSSPFYFLPSCFSRAVRTGATPVTVASPPAAVRLPAATTESVSPHRWFCLLARRPLLAAHQRQARIQGVLLWGAQGQGARHRGRHVGG